MTTTKASYLALSVGIVIIIDLFSGPTRKIIKNV